MRRTWSSLLAFAAIATAAALAFTTGAVAPAKAATCPPPPTSVHPFTPWNDSASYVLTTGASFEQASGWALTGGAQIVSGNAPNRLDPASHSHSLYLPAGSSATSPCTTAPHIVGIVRFFLKNAGVSTGGLHVEVLVKGNTYDAGTITAGSDWQPSAMLPSNAPNYSGAVAYKVRLTPVGSGAAFTADDVYFDPYASK